MAAPARVPDGVSPEQPASRPTQSGSNHRPKGKPRPFGMKALFQEIRCVRPLASTGASSSARPKGVDGAGGETTRREVLEHAGPGLVAWRHDFPESGRFHRHGGSSLGHSKTPWPPVSGHAGTSPGRRLPPAPGYRRVCSSPSFRFGALSAGLACFPGDGLDGSGGACCRVPAAGSQVRMIWWSRRYPIASSGLAAGWTSAPRRVRADRQRRLRVHDWPVPGQAGHPGRHHPGARLTAGPAYLRGHLVLGYRRRRRGGGLEHLPLLHAGGGSISQVRAAGGARLRDAFHRVIGAIGLPER
jgi:hypothetical protein